MFKKFPSKLLIFISIFTQIIPILFMGCGGPDDTEIINMVGTGGGIQPSLSISYMKIYECHYPTWNPIPDIGGSSTADIIKATFIEPQISLQDISILRNRTSPPEGAPPILIWGSQNSIKEFFDDYKMRNNITFDETDYIHVFGIGNFWTGPTNIGGLTRGYYQYYMSTPPNEPWYNPSMCFIMVSNIRNIDPNQTDDWKRKMTVKATAHEIAHARGLADEMGFDDVHNLHFDQNGYGGQHCVMDNISSLFNVNYEYPPKFCYRHARLFGDSLSSKMQRAMNIPDYYMP